MPGNRLKHWTAVLFPVIIAVFLYRRSFRIWFLNDDFAWLGLSLSISSPADLFTALFSPMAQGTVRTFSERLFFLIFERSFGLESLPMRLAAFATFALGLVLLVLVVKRLSGSLLTGTLAAVLWSLNFGTTVALSWLSSYNQILLSTLILAAFYCWLRYAASGKRRWLAAAWLAYLLGFGALESIIVFPGIILVWAFLFDRKFIRRTLPFWIPALCFIAAHWFWIPKVKDSPAYRMYFDSSLLESIAIYWQWLLASPLLNFDPSYSWTLNLTQWILTPSLIAFAAWRTWRRDYLPLFCLLLSAALIAPMLPLRDHRTDYYLASASIGICMLIALLPGRLPKWPARFSPILIAIYILPSFILQQATFEWYLARTAPIRPLVRGLHRAIELHPGKLILLEGITESIYENSFADQALRLLPPAEIRLVPGTPVRTGNLILAPATARTAFENHSAVVYRFDGVKLYDVTREWERTKALELASGLSPEILAGDPAFAAQFLRGWFSIENTHRWMQTPAQVQLGGPFTPTSRFYLDAYVPVELDQTQISITANSFLIYQQVLPKGPVELNIPLPASLIPSPSLTVEIRTSKSIRPPGEDRTLALLVTRIAVR